jgi:hypothetical protein
MSILESNNWTNNQTLLVAVAMDNHPETCDYISELAMNISDVAIEQAADELRQTVTELWESLIEDDPNSQYSHSLHAMYTDLINNALVGVDWHQLITMHKPSV